MIHALIVDDEPLAHEVITHHLKSHTDVNIAGQCLSAAQAMKFLANNEIDLLFLDINMPELTGIDMLKVLAKMPQVIIVSAYQEYALQGFELNVTDYLLKPVSSERFNKALQKVRERHQLKAPPKENQPLKRQHIILKVDRGQRKFELDNIHYLEAFGNYVKLWQDQDMTLVSSTLKQLIENLPSSQFLQCHKSFVINCDFVVGLDTDQLTLRNGSTIKIGKSFKPRIDGIFEKI